MPRSPAKTQKSLSKSTKTPSKSKIKLKDSSNDEYPTTPLSDVSNFHNDYLPPPTTPRVIDFTLALPETDHVEGDGWSSDDSFEEKITWSRHRTRVTPGGFTPRNIQEVRRRLNLAQLPEDNSSSLIVKPLKNRTRPRTPVKSFLAEDPSILPPTPSPKKAIATPSRPSFTAKTPVKPIKETTKGPMILATQGGAGAKMPARPATPSRQITQVKEFTFTSDARSRRITGNVNGSPEKGRKSTVSSKDPGGKQEKEDVQDVNDETDEGDDGVADRMKAREIGKASILAWGETRGRYLDE